MLCLSSFIDSAFTNTANKVAQKNVCFKVSAEERIDVFCFWIIILFVIERLIFIISLYIFFLVLTNSAAVHFSVFPLAIGLTQTLPILYVKETLRGTQSLSYYNRANPSSSTFIGLSAILFPS